ncbi:MAG TPA: family 20 glycosylhydrolase [Thermomicrobiales bacterium]|nr:family 20 glycosylhydrolase [Thermomicrobiales bacterium]
MDVIPFPRSTTATADVSCTITGSSAVVTGERVLQPIAEWLATEAERLASIPLSATSGTGPPIELALDDRLTSGVTTSGVRADGAALDCERYRLDVFKGSIRIVGATPEGVFRGATTLIHLLAQAAVDGLATLVGVSITDAPRFAWRGLSLDVVRTFHPVDTVKKVIDLLALYKLNVLHLHLTDSEGWRFEVPAYPNLTAIGGQTARDGRSGGYYTHSDYAEILAHAGARFVTVVPEFDSPGHTASVLRAYPDLGSPEMHAAPDAMQYLDPSMPGVWDLVRAVYDEMARVHPNGRMHVGGDEAIAMDEATFTHYMETALPAARSTGKGIVAWQETARAGFTDGDLMQFWISPHLVERVRLAAEDPDNSWLVQAFPDPAVRDAFVNLFLQAPDDLPKALEQGADVVISRADKLYLDTRYVEPSADPAQEDARARLGLPQAVYGSGTIEDAFAWDPATIQPELPLGRIAGVEGAIWCETITDERDLMFQLLPRLAGVAEKGWSDTREWTDYHPRLGAQRQLWDAMGVSSFVSSVVWPEG